MEDGRVCSLTTMPYRFKLKSCWLCKCNGQEVLTAPALLKATATFDEPTNLKALARGVQHSQDHAFDNVRANSTILVTVIIMDGMTINVSP